MDDIRQELRKSVKDFVLCESVNLRGAQPPRHLNIYLFGPQGSGKTSFILTAIRALLGHACVTQSKELRELEHSVHRSDDGTSLYSVYPLTDRICLHDTRGQREYTDEEMAQLALVLDGRAKPASLVKQRKRYWLLLREFWKTDERMQRTFSKQIMLKSASIDTEPHFVFLVIDPNQQDLLLEDVDFRECYSQFLGDLRNRGVPFAILCTHGDTLTPGKRRALQQLPRLLGLEKTEGPNQNGLGQLGGSTGGEYLKSHGATNGVGGPQVNSLDASGGYFESKAVEGGDDPGAAFVKMPEPLRIVTNYVSRGPVDTEYPPPPPRPPVFPADPSTLEKDEDEQQDTHTLLVLLDALRQADFFAPSG